MNLMLGLIEIDKENERELQGKWLNYSQHLRIRSRKLTIQVINVWITKPNLLKIGLDELNQL